MSDSEVIPLEHVQSRILVLRDQRVVLDRDLATLYGVPTFRLNEAVKRNVDRFPEDFRFQLTVEETNRLRSQFAISKRGRGGRRTRPWAFTEHGALMAATILNSSRAVQMSVVIIRAFVRLRQLLVNHKALSAKLAELDSRVGATTANSLPSSTPSASSRRRRPSPPPQDRLPSRQPMNTSPNDPCTASRLRRSSPNSRRISAGRSWRSVCRCGASNSIRA